MKLPRFLTPSHWTMTPKLLMAFLFTAILPVLATSLFSLNYFYGAAYENAQQTLARELQTARHFFTEWTRGLEADARLASKENLVAINLSLGLTGSVLEYFESLRSDRNWVFTELLDAQGVPQGRSQTPQALATNEQREEALRVGGKTFFVDGDGKPLVEVLIPIVLEGSSERFFLLLAADPASSTPGAILDVIRKTVSGPVVLGSGHRVQGSAPDGPEWDAGAAWPDVPASDALLPVKAKGTTYLFGFTTLPDLASSTPVWIGVSFALQGFQNITNAAAGGLIAITLVFVLLSVVTAVGFSRGLTKPLLMMARQADAWRGQGGRRLDITSHDETAVVGRAFNEALDRLDGTLDSLRKTQSYLKNIFNSLTSVLVSVDETGTVQEWNVAAEQFGGLKAAEALGRNVADLSPVFLGLESTLTLAFQTREPQFLHRTLGHGREQRGFDLGLYPLVWNGVTGVVIRMDDVTETLRKDRQLRQAQKMETIGTLTEGIAHNFNNLLTGISGTVSLMDLDLQRQALDQELLTARMAMIEEATRKAAEIVRRLVTLGRSEPGEMHALDLAELVREVAKTSKMVLDKSVEVELQVPETAPVRGDRSQLEQCLLNLIINAAHAMTIMRLKSERAGGVVQIRLGPITAVNEFHASHPGALKSDYWLLQVHDSGVGISGENLTKIFDPFFTTKEQDKGSGLGLAMVYSSIRQQNGFIDVYSEEGRGTTFSVYLPILHESVDQPVVRRSVGVIRGHGLILVADDERVVQATARMMLQASGYDVVIANDGTEALAVYRARQHEIRAVILDSSMPRLSGQETLEALRKMNPGIKVILSSGLLERTAVEDHPLGPHVQFLAKPYGVGELSQALSVLLRDS